MQIQEGTRRPHRRNGLLYLLAIAFAAAVAVEGCSSINNYKIRNATGMTVVITRVGLNTSVRANNLKWAFVEGDFAGDSGDLIVTLPDGQAWAYKNLRTTLMKLSGTTFVGHGLATLTLTLVLDREGRLFAIPGNAGPTTYEDVPQPLGFPLSPDKGDNVERITFGPPTFLDELRATYVPQYSWRSVFVIQRPPCDVS